MYAPPRVRRVQNTSGTLVKPLGAAYTAKQPAPSPASAARYKLVSATVDTGSNALNTRPRPTRPALPFPLISASTLAALIAAHTASEESVYALTDRSSAAHGRRTGREEDEESVASSVLEAVGGEGLPVGTAEAPSYLLLDVREAEAYAASHIAGALSFPSIMLRRDQYPSILLQFRNAAQRVVIVYDQNDLQAIPRLGAAVATHLVDRGYVNVRLLAGGLERLFTKHPHLCTGPVALSTTAAPSTARNVADSGRSTLRATPRSSR